MVSIMSKRSSAIYLDHGLSHLSRQLVCRKFKAEDAFAPDRPPRAGRPCLNHDPFASQAQAQPLALRDLPEPGGVIAVAIGGRQIHQTQSAHNVPAGGVPAPDGQQHTAGLRPVGFAGEAADNGLGLGRLGRLRCLGKAKPSPIVLEEARYVASLVSMVRPRPLEQSSAVVEARIEEAGPKTLQSFGGWRGAAILPATDQLREVPNGRREG
jgi:hypothetical protein